MPNKLQNIPPVSKCMQPTTSALTESVCVECSMSTEYVCVECSSNPYCKCCFVKVHSAGVVFKKHQLKHSASLSSIIGRELGTCKSHSKKLMYFCQTCTFPICHSCVGTSHSKHETVTLQKIVNAVENRGRDNLFLFNTILPFRTKKWTSMRL